MATFLSLPLITSAHLQDLSPPEETRFSLCRSVEGEREATGWCLLDLRYPCCPLHLTTYLFSLPLSIYFSLCSSIYIPPLCHSIPLCFSLFLTVIPIASLSISLILCRSLFLCLSLPCRHSFILPSLCLPLAPCACTWLLAL